MLSPQKDRKDTTTADTDPPSTPSKTIPLQRGHFAHGIWHCNCRDRAPAVKLQTRNQGVNHGRWCAYPPCIQDILQKKNKNKKRKGKLANWSSQLIVYTCQRRPQSNQNCGFFLWSSDAEIREKCVLFGGEEEPSTPSSRVRWTEPGMQGGGGGGLLTPQTEGRMSSDHGYGYGHGYRVPGSYPGNFEASPGRRMSAGASVGASASAKAKARMMEEDEIDNPGIRRVSPFTDRLRRVSGGGQEQQQRQRQERLESFFSKQDSPRKTPRTANVTSPGKRKWGSDIEDEDDEVLQTQRAMEQTTPTRKRLSDPFFSFSSPLQSLPQSQSFDICQTPTPTKYTNPLTTTTSMIQSSPSNSQPGATATLAHQAITLLENKGVVIARSTQEELAALLNRHEMKMQGVIRGRDVSRMALKKREEEVEWLRERVDGLEVELKRTTGD